MLVVRLFAHDSCVAALRFSAVFVFDVGRGLPVWSKELFYMAQACASPSVSFQTSEQTDKPALETSISVTFNTHVDIGIHTDINTSVSVDANTTAYVYIYLSMCIYIYVYVYIYIPKQYNTCVYIYTGI